MNDLTSPRAPAPSRSGLFGVHSHRETRVVHSREAALLLHHGTEEEMKGVLILEILQTRAVTGSGGITTSIAVRWL